MNRRDSKHDFPPKLANTWNSNQPLPT
uniref:Uncharacterized protein n=1 Tax=Tetraselmis sp. GSL018 TaxID=582737 RepID=A0A061R0L4_9CHLO